MAKLLVFDSHPVQYRVPVWQLLASNDVDTEVVYASDCSIKGHADKGFGKTFAWDEPMLEGYKFRVLNCEKGTPLAGWGSLTGDGVSSAIDEINPDAILLTGINYRYDLVAYINARRHHIPLWLRCETQDEAVGERSKLKGLIRAVVYRIIYGGFSKIFYIGELNKAHYLKHGVPVTKLVAARYSTVDRYNNWSETKKQEVRTLARQDVGIGAADFVVGFSGKFITKKNPDILFEMLEYIGNDLRKRLVLYFVGSGELEPSLRIMADEALGKFGVRTYFSGFVNQSKIALHYLAMDIMILPSRRMGETWGLVANEAMQAGCGVIVSDAVGSGADFKDWERFRIFKVGDSKQLANCIESLSVFHRSFGWASSGLANYSIEATANVLKTQLQNLQLKHVSN